MTALNCCSVVVDPKLCVAVGCEPEADGITEVTKNLEKQAIEDKEKEEDAEDGDYRLRASLQWQSNQIPSVLTQNLFSRRWR